MKALFRKDLRENFGLAILGAVILSLILLKNIGFAESSAIQMVRNGGNSYDLQPVLSSATLTTCPFFFVIFAGLLGFVQSRNESHKDMWAFLIHRPTTRTQIFLGKISAGLLLYFLGAGIPLLLFVVYLSIPGHIAAPFEWAMVLPLTMIWLSGIASYFAGMITGLRQARWFGSKTFAFGGAIMATVTVFTDIGLWQSMIALTLFIVILGTALWGAYQSGGFYRGQPVLGKATLVLSLMAGSGLVITLTVGLFQSTLGRDNHSFSYRTYSISRNGTIFIESNNGGDVSFMDLEGKRALNPETGKPWSEKEFLQFRSATYSATADYKNESRRYSTYYRHRAFFKPWSYSGKNLWYTDRHGKLKGYNVETRQLVGEIVPSGATGDDPFVESPYSGDYVNSYNLPHLLSTRSSVYLVDLESRQMKPIFTTSATNPIGGFYEAEYATNALILTKETISMINGLGYTILTLPYQPGPGTYPSVTVANLTAGSNQPYQFEVMLSPDSAQNYKTGWKMPLKVIAVPKDAGATNTTELPTLRESEYKQPFEDLMAALEPTVTKINYSKLTLHKKSLPAFCLCAMCAGVTVFFGRRYKFSNGALIAWALFVFLGGVFALMTFFCVQEFPKREVCPKCKKLRTVDHELCDHCGAEFAPPELNGTEIFEPLQKKTVLEPVVME
jgi:hypothetical protein